MVEALRRWVEHATFHRVVIGLILANGALMGLETWPSVAAAWGPALDAAERVIQVLFVAEIALRLAAHGRRPLGFFRSGWNVFDFGVVALSLLPAAGPLATVARLARVLRAARLVSGLPELRLIIGTMLKSIPSMGHVVVLLGLLVYIYGVLGVHLFGAVDPAHWGDLGAAARTLFVMMTLEGWVDILRQAEAATPWAWAYFASYIVLAVFVVINLFIAVVINNLEKARAEEGDVPAGPRDDALAAEVRRLADRVEALARVAAAAPVPGPSSPAPSRDGTSSGGPPAVP